MINDKMPLQIPILLAAVMSLSGCQDSSLKTSTQQPTEPSEATQSIAEDQETNHTTQAGPGTPEPPIVVENTKEDSEAQKRESLKTTIQDISKQIREVVDGKVHGEMRGAKVVSHVPEDARIKVDYSGGNRATFEIEFEIHTYYLDKLIKSETGWQANDLFYVDGKWQLQDPDKFNLRLNQ